MAIRLGTAAASAGARRSCWRSDYGAVQRSPVGACVGSTGRCRLVGHSVIAGPSFVSLDAPSALGCAARSPGASSTRPRSRSACALTAAQVFSPLGRSRDSAATAAGLLTGTAIGAGLARQQLAYGTAGEWG